ncbi:MAG: 6-phosphofructokinase [Candidatus Brockarchaeota archaeon]|nr:6-phosphofructokinase [Candidatus Brockarchaeota archaeon]
MKRIAVVTSGGDAPGMNAAIRAVVRTALFHGLEVLGVERGYKGLIEGQVDELTRRSVSGIVNLGGTVLKTARCERMKAREGVAKAVETLRKNGIEGVVIIGGDGSLRGAWKLYKASGIPVIGIPASIDNDVAGTDYTIGFDTAANTALEAIDKIRDTATSHERVFIIEVMGRNRGFLALQVGLAAGAEFILVPEIRYSLGKICRELEEARKKGKRSSIIVMAEGAGDSSEVAREIARRTGYEVRVSTLGYVQRGGPPTAFSRHLASVFGHEAVRLLIKGRGGLMVGMERGRVVAHRLDYAWRGRKKLDRKLYRLNAILAT